MDKNIINNLNILTSAYDEVCGFTKVSVIKKIKNKWKIFSEKGKELGSYDTKNEAVKRLKQIEYFKHKKASGITYSSIVRELFKNHDINTLEKFKEKYKEEFDKAYLNNEEHPEDIALDECLKILKIKTASAIEMGNPEYAGKYLADLIKFITSRISPENRQKSLNNLKRKIYYLNEYEIANKKMPVSSSLGQSITLLKNILLEQHPQYIRQVLNNVVKFL